MHKSAWHISISMFTMVCNLGMVQQNTMTCIFSHWLPRVSKQICMSKGRCIQGQAGSLNDEAGYNPSSNLICHSSQRGTSQMQPLCSPETPHILVRHLHSKWNAWDGWLFVLWPSLNQAFVVVFCKKKKKMLSLSLSQNRSNLPLSELQGRVYLLLWQSK